jgi:ribosomal protein S18 acetylase RimI-like enzyme
VLQQLRWIERILPVSDILIRDVRPDDVDAIVSIAVEAWRPIYAFYRETLGDELYGTAYPDALKRKGEQVRRACGRDSGMSVLVAELDGRVAGFVTFRADVVPGMGEIGNNAVHPGFRGRGIGGMLYERVFEELRRLGQTAVKVGTGGEGDPAHVPARRAYEKAGFDRKLPGVTYFRRL